MRMGLLTSGLGLDSEDPNLPDLVRRMAEQFVRAGGCVTLTEWSALSEDERLALIDAHNRVYDAHEGTGEALERVVTP